MRQWMKYWQPFFCAKKSNKLSDEKKTKAHKIGPWTRLSCESVYDNPWLHVTQEQVLTPAGSSAIYGKVHFKNLAIGIVPLDKHLNTVLVGQHRYTLDQYSWEIPMGGGALDIDPLISAQRELSEETGLHGGDWQCLFKLHTSNSVTDEAGYVYLATNLQQGEQQLEDSESDLVLKTLPIAEALDMVARGEITDVISIAGLYAVDRWLGQQR